MSYLIHYKIEDKKIDYIAEYILSCIIAIKNEFFRNKEFFRCTPKYLQNVKADKFSEFQIRNAIKLLADENYIELNSDNSGYKIKLTNKALAMINISKKEEKEKAVGAAPAARGDSKIVYNFSVTNNKPRCTPQKTTEKLDTSLEF